LDTWDELLAKVSARIGLSKFQLNGIRNQLISENPGLEINPMLASKLSSIMMSKISNGDLTRGDFVDMSEDEWAMMETMDPFKVLVCHMVSDITILGGQDVVTELESLKRLSRKIPAVITTNYDEFLERAVFDEFKTLVYPDDYYFNQSSGYGEILKIHGTVSRPESIVITEEDYRRLKLESKVVTARLTSLMCQNPVIFLGYSISDKEIHDTILDLISSLKQTDLEKIRGHLLRVSVRPGMNKSEWGPKTETFSGKKVEITQIEMPNLNVLYRYLDKFTPVATPMEIRRYQEMIREIVLSADPNCRKVELIDVENIDRTKPGDLAVIFGKSSSIGSMMKGITGYEVKDALLDVLLKRAGGLDVSSTHFTYWLSQNRICKGKGSAPVFFYLVKYGIGPDDLGPGPAGYVKNLHDKLSQKIQILNERCSAVESKDDIPGFLDCQIKSFPRFEAIAFFHYSGLLSREECRCILERLYNADIDKYKDEARMTSGLRAAISMLDLREYEEKIAQRPVLSPTECEVADSVPTIK
jgi:hypothetical protein